MIKVTLVWGAWMSLAGAQETAPQTQRGAPPTGTTSEAAEALVRGDAVEAATLAGQAIEARPEDPWAHYNRAAAMARLRQTDDAIAAYQQAEKLFSEKDGWGKSVAMWGRAHTLQQAGRCDDAAAAFRDYMAFVATSDPESVAVADKRITACKSSSASARRPAAEPASPDVKPEPMSSPASREAKLERLSPPASPAKE